jgi:hypothetical protein
VLGDDVLHVESRLGPTLAFAALRLLLLHLPDRELGHLPPLAIGPPRDGGVRRCSLGWSHELARELLLAPRPLPPCLA